MSRAIAIAGESGSGKTTSLRNLDPKQTFYFDCDKKGLSWKGWRKQYNPENKNYKAISEAGYILSAMSGINAKSAHIKYIIIDTLNGIMIDDEFRRMGEKNYDKWMDLASSVWDLVSKAHDLRDDLTVIFTAHTQTDHDENGYMFTHIKTSGKKLDKISLESKFTTVLISKAKSDGTFVFETHAHNSTAKTPLGAFEQDEIPNDIVSVLKVLEDY